jgi:DNA-binding MarR family transcriptional regulator
MDVTPQQLSDEIMRLINNFKADFDKVAEGCHLTKVQLFALQAINYKDEIPMGQMADALHCDPSNVTGIVDRLVNHGLIVREESPKDRRTKIIRLTEKGKAFVGQIKAEMPVRMGCDQMTAPDRSNLCSLLRKLNELHPGLDQCPGQAKKTTA